MQTFRPQLFYFTCWSALLLIPLTVLSIPIIKPRDIGVRQLTFIFPPLSLFVALAVKELTNYVRQFIQPSITSSLGFIVPGLLALECARPLENRSSMMWEVP